MHIKCQIWYVLECSSASRSVGTTERGSKSKTVRKPVFISTVYNSVSMSILLQFVGGSETVKIRFESKLIPHSHTSSLDLIAWHCLFKKLFHFISLTKISVCFPDKLQILRNPCRMYCMYSKVDKRIYIYCTNTNIQFPPLLYTFCFSLTTTWRVVFCI